METDDLTQGTPTFPYAVLSLLLVATLIGITSIIWGTIRSNDLLIEAKDNYAEVHALYGDILLFDEMLTMSARQAVAEGLFESEGRPARANTGDEGGPRGRAHWTKRYYITVDRLDQRLEMLEVHLAATPELEALHEQTSRANDVLVKMEERALEARSESDLLAARAALSGREYQTQKTLYRDGMVAMMQKVRDQFADDVRDNGRVAAAMVPIAVVVLGLMILVWGLALRSLLRWRRAVVLARREAERTRLTLQDAVDAARLGVFTVFADGRVEASTRCMALMAINSAADIETLLASLARPDRDELTELLSISHRADDDDDLAHARRVAIDDRGFLELSWRPGIAEGEPAIFGLVRDVTKEVRASARLSEANAHLETQVIASTERARVWRQDNTMLLRELLRSEQNERARLGQMLHDDLQQYLVAARMHAAMARDALNAQDHDNARLGAVVEELDNAVTSARTLHRQLRQPPLDQIGLAEALEHLAARSPLTVRLVITTLPKLRLPAAWLAWRGAQELLLNAAKHSGVSDIDVEVAVDDEGNLRLEVADAGVGFDSSAATEGTGLAGLSQRAEAVGGQLEVVGSTSGTRVTLTIPEAVADTAETSSEFAQHSVSRLSSARCSVVVADDSQSIRQLLVRLLTTDGRFDVVGTAASGAEVLIQVQVLRPDAVVLDYSMPGLGGDEVTRRLTQDFPAIRVIGFSALVEEAAPKMMSAGAAAVVGKGEEPSALLDALLDLENQRAS